MITYMFGIVREGRDQLSYKPWKPDEEDLRQTDNISALG